MRRRKGITTAMVIALAFGVLSAFASTASRAATEAPFTQQAFSASAQEGKPILVEIDASWCPTCAQQRPILARLSRDPQFADLIVYKVDFDTQKNVVREMGAQMQSTLIVFHGSTERGRSVGDTNAHSIQALLERAEH